MGVTRKGGTLLYILFRILLGIAIIASIIQQKYVNLFLSILTAVLISLSDFWDETFKTEAPGTFEVSILVFLYLSLFLEKILFFVKNLWWIENSLRFILAVIVTMLGFFLVYIINRTKKATMNLRPSFIAFFAFSFALAGALSWEIIKFLLSYFFSIQLITQLSKNLLTGLTIYSLGALFASATGYIMIKYFGSRFVKTVIAKFGKKYPNLVASIASPEDFVSELIKSGESERIEFKSSIRTNIYTNEHDKRVEHSLLKTIVAFLNSNGGTLLVGISDDGEIVGLEKDNFKNMDKIKLHLSMLIKKHISNSHNARIIFEDIIINNKAIIKIHCKKSKKESFLNFFNEEEFFIRAGPSSIKLTGSRLVDYIKINFRKK